MNIKKSLTAVLAMSCLIFFSACGTSTNTSPPSSSPPEEKTDEIKVEDSTKTNEKGTIKNMSIDFASDFSDGVAWVTASTNEEGTSHEQFLIDKKGISCSAPLCSQIRTEINLIFMVTPA